MKNRAKIFVTVFLTGLLCRRGMNKSRLSANLSFYLRNDSDTLAMAIITMEKEFIVCVLSNGAISDDLE